MPNALYDQMNAEYNHPSNLGYQPPPRNMLAKMAQDIENRKQLMLAQQVASGQIPHDIVYGEQGLESPNIGGISLDPTDYIGPGEIKTLGSALLAKLGMGAIKGGLPMMVGMTASKGDDMARLIREAQAQIDAENATRNLVRSQPDNNRVRNALIGLGAGGAGVAGGYYGADYLSK
jgi:hypothetical protein